MQSDACCKTIRRAFDKIPHFLHGMAERPLSRQQAEGIFERIRSIPEDVIPFYLGEILCEVCRSPEEELLNSVIEFIDFNLTATVSEAEHGKIFGGKSLDAYNQTTQRMREENTRMSSLFSKEQAGAIVCWLRWANESSKVWWWRKEQLDGAISYWDARA